MEIAVLLAYASALLSGALAATVAWNERRSPAHWFFAAGMAGLAAEALFSGLTADAVLPEEAVRWQGWRVVALSFLPGTWLLFSLTYARGSYRESLRKWRLPLLAVLAVPVGVAILWRGDLLATISGFGPWGFRLALPGQAVNLVFLVSCVAVLMNLERTYRAAVGMMRWRIKFMVLGVFLLFLARAYTSSQVLVHRSILLPFQTVNSGALLLAALLITRSLARAGHFEVNVYPSQSVLRNSLTLLLAGLYLLIVGVFAKIVAFLGGDVAFPLKAFVVLVALVLLGMALLSDRVKLYTRRFVSRHFQRPEYDYRTVWKTFTEATARQVEQPDLCGVVVKLVSDLFQALSVTIWLLDERKEGLTFGASTSMSEAQAGPLRLDPADAVQVLIGLGRRVEPVDMDASKEIWAALLRRMHPDQFPKGGNRICVALLAGGELLAVMTLGDRVGGVPYSVQDFDLLKSVAGQVATSLLNLRFSQKLLQAKQLEAFQAMSAFFVHDLKNTASTLSLMLQNLPVHFNDPSFRQDALRGIAKTVAHINDLISRLGLLRQELAIHAVESDLNELVTETLKGFSGAPEVELAKDLQPLPRVNVDRGQIQNVVTNLLLNAIEAVQSRAGDAPASTAAAPGRVRIETSQRNGWVVLAVADNGCGMSAEFIQHSLFRPFQTTKKRGLGIGMYQCKMIVEAHRGRIEVESRPGQGTAFRVLLPMMEREAERWRIQCLRQA